MLKNKLWLFGDSYVANGRPGTWINKLAKKLNCTIEHTGEDSSSLEVAAWELHCCKERIGRNDKVIFMFTQPHRITLKGKHFSVPMLEAMDLDASNGISYTQFLAATLESSAVDEGLWTEAYEAMDIDGTGAVTVENLKTCLAEWGDDELAAAIAEADLSGDGVVSKEEFLAVCRSSEKIGDVRERYLGELLGL